MFIKFDKLYKNKILKYIYNVEIKQSHCFNK